MKIQLLKKVDDFLTGRQYSLLGSKYGDLLNLTVNSLEHNYLVKTTMQNGEKQNLSFKEEDFPMNVVLHDKEHEPSKKTSFVKKDSPKKPRIFNKKEKWILQVKCLEDLDLYIRTINVFKLVKITTLTELLNYSEFELRKFRYMGDRAIENLNEELNKIKLKLRK